LERKSQKASQNGAFDPKRSKTKTLCRNAATVSYSIFCCRDIVVLAGIEVHARYVGPTFPQKRPISSDLGEVSMHANRRDLLLAGAGAASTALFWSSAARLMAEGTVSPPETTTIRLAKSPTICIAPQYVVSDLLTGEGFAKVAYIESDGGLQQTKAVANGDLDFTLHFSGPLLLEVDRGSSITF
jgi:hypothetical protein